MTAPSLSPAGPLMNTTSMLLSEMPMVLSHNAATSYMPMGNVFGNVYMQSSLYAKNQLVGTFSDQLNCGARALDLELFYDGDTVGFAHGPVRIQEINFQDGLDNILSWSKKNPDELVLLMMDCPAGTELCSSRVTDILKDKNITFISNCTLVDTMTVQEALAQGPVLAVTDQCLIQNYDETLGCHGFTPNSSNQPQDEQYVHDLFNQNSMQIFIAQYEETRAVSERLDTYTCWQTDDQKNFAHDPLWDYLKTTKAPASSAMWKWQAFWQVNNDTIPLGMAQPFPLPKSVISLSSSSILADLDKSELNKDVLAYLTNQDKPNVNLVTLDAVCSTYGRQIITALRPTNSTLPTPSPTPISFASSLVSRSTTIFFTVIGLVYSLTNN